MIILATILLPMIAGAALFALPADDRRVSKASGRSLR